LEVRAQSLLATPHSHVIWSGDTVLTQWFERARFEYHPNNPAAYRVLLGRLGAEVLGLQQTSDIVGTSWRLESYGPANAPVPAAAKPATIAFGADGSVSGSTGCNSYGGSYTLDGERLTFGPLVGTLIACPEEDITQQERELLGALQGTVRYELAGGKLRIFYAADSKVFTFGAVPASSIT
jgi:heat shock protein HslJ